MNHTLQHLYRARRQTVLAALVWCIGCTTAAPPDAPIFSCCVDALHPRGIRLTGCESDIECPLGAVCRSSVVLPGPDGGAADAADAPELLGDCGLPTGAAGRRCRARGGGMQPGALVDGFGVPALELDVTVAGEVDVSWPADPRYRYIECAVFTCAPSVEIVGSHAGEPIRSITNLERCADDRQYVEAPESTASFGITATVGRRGIVRPDRLACEDPQTIDFVAVGCWAVGDTRVLAASRLVDLLSRSPAPTRARFFPPCGERDGVQCLLRTELPGGTEIIDGIGLCYAAECRTRCLLGSDCPRIVSRPDAPGGDAGFIFSDATCYHFEGAYLGACIPE